MKPWAAAIAVMIAPTLLTGGPASSQPFGHAPGRARGGGFGAFAVSGPPHGARAYGGPASVRPGYLPRQGGWRRGQRLPPGYHGQVIGDFTRYHLRRPPRGYVWYRDGNEFVLAAIGTGLIFDVIGMGR